MWSRSSTARWPSRVQCPALEVDTRGSWGLSTYCNRPCCSAVRQSSHPRGRRPGPPLWEIPPSVVHLEPATIRQHAGLSLRHPSGRGMMCPPTAGGVTRSPGEPDPGVRWGRWQPGPQATCNLLPVRPVSDQPVGVLPLPLSWTRRHTGTKRVGPKALLHPCGKRLYGAAAPQLRGRGLDPCRPDREVRSVSRSGTHPRPAARPHTWGGSLDQGSRHQDGTGQETGQIIAGPRAEFFMKRPLRTPS
ncbi:hypothetical protein NDU88_008154 [Pleurodeles waltl]|uniref:Uncharacterized protein n=1 Tax=Pleurodeles waltl TaxID=8319 RepID=A0AAV7N8W7_PLEWA|nr:hypothetical protein NDU88_008154 [Pleurodeles waltl]